MEKKKKVVLLSSLPPPYMGPTIAAKIILNSKLKNKFTLIHLDTSDHRELNSLYKFDFRNTFLAIKHFICLFWLIITREPDLIYIPICQTTRGYLRDSAFILLSKIFRRKVICHLRGGNFKNWYDSANSLIRWYVRFIHSLINGQIVLGKNLKKLFRGIVTENKIYVVPNGKNGEIQYKRKCIDENYNGNTIKIVYLSNMKRTKGLFYVLNALPELYEKYGKRIEFVLAGRWTHSETKKIFDAFCGRYNYLPIKVIGPIYGREKYDLLLASDIFIFTPIEEEGHPWVIIEAMIAGLPIISTDQGAISESVINGKNGYIVEEKDHKQIAEKIKFLIDNPKLRLKMGEESRRIYLENYTEDIMIERLAAVFNSVLDD